jgi:REP-associated tyrosine transposase
MVRAGIVDHPSQWYWCGYNEIQNPRRKNVLIDYEKLGALTGFNTFEGFQAAHRSWIDGSLATHGNRREQRWSESIAVGSNTFTTDILSQLGPRAKGRKIIETGQTFQIREETESYNPLFDGEKDNIAPENTIIWQQDGR